MPARSTVLMIKDEWIEAIVKCIGNRFKDLQETPVYKHLCPTLDTQSWPTEKSHLIAHGDASVMQLVQHFDSDDSKDVWRVEVFETAYFRVIWQNGPIPGCWAAIFSLPAYESKFSNILNIIELLYS